MSTTNTILKVIGIFVIIVGIAALFNPSFAKLINAPGGPRIKAIIALITGIIIFIIGLTVQLPA